ncbi:SRPBCC family protein [Emticicia sp. BO119]|uniref:SRPBCC family protein n=1 Tax=Emticicia sp. BO119 TaxID=2757768 RepID=UPI0015F0279C|nr:SRPBCC family protein [Emticicia sp. BO119]MBA4849985.1 SRPBCC family protein [Emticicia sp. BO119]
MHTLHNTQKLPLTLQYAWDFLSTPANLKIITPEYMGFEMTSLHHGDKMYAGQIITYIVKPILNIPLKWCTEITHVHKPDYFVDEQRFGPYSFWHHQHRLVAIENGVLMEDIVHYKLPLGFIGRWVNSLLVQKQLEDIFEFRKQKLIELFGEYKEN